MQLVPYGALDYHPRYAPARWTALGEACLKSGWSAGSQKLASIAPPVPWDKGHRSLAMHVQSFEPLATVLIAHRFTGDARFLAAATAYALDWCGQHPHFVPRRRDTASAEDSFAWYDMAIGMRSYRLAYILDAAACDSAVGDATVERLHAALRLNVAALADDSNFAAHSNHGFYQALAQLAVAHRFEGEPEIVSQSFRVQANARLKVMIARQYFPEGMHREHSPGYHLMTLTALKNAERAGLIGSAALSQTIARAEEALSWLILPDGNIPAIGDTDPWPLRPEEKPWRWFGNPRLAAVLRGENTDRGPNGVSKAFRQSGYFCVQARTSSRLADSAAASALVQIAGFHSLVHKQADHLSFVWSDRGTDLVIDPGRFSYGGRLAPQSPLHKLGFQYSDRERLYVESTRAHNVVEIDGREFDRRKGRKFGSAILDHGVASGMHWSLCHYTPFAKIGHLRLLGLHPGRFLVVVDLLHDSGGEPHGFRQWFHLGPALHPVRDHAGLLADLGDAGTLRIVPLLPDQRAGEPVSGQVEPHMCGWHCPAAHQLAPSASFAMDRPAGPQATFATLFTFEAAISCDAATATPARRRIDLAWIADGARRALSIKPRMFGRWHVRFDDSSTTSIR